MRKINYQGKEYQFPDDFTDEEISQMLAGEESAPPEAPPVEAPPEPGTMERVGQFINENIPGVESGSKWLAEKLGISSPDQVSEVLMNLPLPRAGALQPFSDVQEGIEALPAAGAGVGSLAGPAGTVAGGVTGEALRQGVRGLMGAPRATGLIQSLSGMDPNSLEASLTGLGAEGVTSLGGEAIARLAPPLLRSARRSTQNLLQLPEKLLQKELKRGDTKGGELLDRLVEEGIAPPLTTRRSHVSRAEQRLKEASDVAEAMHSSMANEPLKESKVDEVLSKLEKALPPERPGGTPRAGNTEMKTAQDVLDDAVGFISESRASKEGLTLSRARAEKQRLSDEISTLFESSGDTPLSKKALQRASKAWQEAIEGSFPELGAADMRRSDLITINKYLKKALRKAEYAGADLSAEGVSAGAAVAGRMSIPAMVLGKAAALATAGPLSSFSGSSKRLLAKIVSSPAMAQSWLRLMGQLGEAGFGGTEEEEQ